MSSFAFVPRSISKQKKQTHIKPAAPLPPNREAGPSVTPTQNLTPVGAQTPVEKYSSLDRDAEYLALLELSLSDHAVWCNPELHHRMKSGHDGYMPMRYLVSTAPLLSYLEPRPSEATLMRCIRSSSLTTLDARMLISEPSRSEWFDRGSGGSSYHTQMGGFEVRRKDWETLLQNLANNIWTKDWWDHCTIYIERLPAAHRSIPAVARYVQSLLPSEKDKEASLESSKPFVQSVVFPAHHLAPQGEPSRCKGFAFIVLPSSTLVNYLIELYPWDHPDSANPEKEQEAKRFGTRVLSKLLWDKLKAEYLAYQQQLLAQVAEEAASAELQDNVQLDGPAHQAETKHRPVDAKNSPPGDARGDSSWYPQGCLVFVRNIHPETNKTTLRTLFNGALFSSGGGVDYVDFNKGIDSCHLRLASPSATAELVSHFTSHPTSQRNGLDSLGLSLNKGGERIEMEVVQGKREELYWEKIPEKIRNTAMDRLRATREDRILPQGQDDGGERKRRRKG